MNDEEPMKIQDFNLSIPLTHLSGTSLWLAFR
jgi:hypothetical protein